MRYESLGQVVLISVKSMRMCHLFGAFLTSITLANHIGYFVSVMNRVLDTLPSCYWLGRKVDDKMMTHTLVSILGMLERGQTNKSTFLMNC